jgi:hypothetical protein
MKLYTVHFSTPYLEANSVVLEAPSLTDAKQLFNTILGQNKYFKVKFHDTEMIVLSNTIKVVKASVYKESHK